MIMKDIFIDNSAAINLSTPLTDPFKIFVKWLYSEGTLVLNKKLKVEYIAGNQTLSIVIDRLTRDGRVNNIPDNLLKEFIFTSVQEKRFLSNKRDRIHLKSVFLSKRKLAISNDTNFIIDINGFNKVDGIQPTCVDCPSKINYQ